jgi:hypothetical protein
MQMNKIPDSLDHLQFDPKYNLQMMFELLVEIIALQQATNKVLNRRLYGEEEIMIELEIIKSCADLKPRIMESLYAKFGKTPSIKPTPKPRAKSKPKPKPRS